MIKRLLKAIAIKRGMAGIPKGFASFLESKGWRIDREASGAKKIVFKRDGDPYAIVFS